MNCTICGKPVVLVPSAAARAAKYGGRPQDYTALFTTHTQCQLDKNAADLAELMKRSSEKPHG